MDCKRCARCCKRGPCIIDKKLKDNLKDKFKFIKDEFIKFKWRPPLRNNGICKYLVENMDDTYTCPVIEQSEEFKKHMESGKCAIEQFI